MSLRDGSRWTARELRDRARATGLVPTLRHVYMVLDSYANGAPECYASQGTLMADTGLSRSVVQNALRDLEEIGAITRTRGAGRSGTTLYRIADPPDCKSSNDASPGAGPAREPGTRGKGVKDQELTADQQEQELNQPLPLRPGSRAPGSRAGTNANSASRPVTPDPKPKRQRSTRLVRSPSGEVKHARVKSGEEELVDDRRPVGFTPVEGGETRRQSAKERNEERAAARRAAAAAGTGRKRGQS